MAQPDIPALNPAATELPAATKVELYPGRLAVEPRANIERIKRQASDWYWRTRASAGDRIARAYATSEQAALEMWSRIRDRVRSQATEHPERVVVAAAGTGLLLGVILRWRKALATDKGRGTGPRRKQD